MALPQSLKNAYQHLRDNTDIMIGLYGEVLALDIISAVEIYLNSRWQEQSAFQSMIDDTCTKSQVYVLTSLAATPTS